MHVALQAPHELRNAPRAGAHTWRLCRSLDAAADTDTDTVPHRSHRGAVDARRLHRRRACAMHREGRRLGYGPPRCWRQRREGGREATALGRLQSTDVRGSTGGTPCSRKYFLEKITLCFLQMLYLFVVYTLLFTETKYLTLA